MEIKILKNKAKEMEIQIDKKNETILNPIKEMLLKNEKVEYAEYSIEHPLLSKPRLYFKIKEGNPKEILIDALKELQKEAKSFREQIERKK